MAARSSRRIASAIRAVTIPIPSWLAPVPSMMVMFAYRTSCSTLLRNASADSPLFSSNCDTGMPATRADDHKKNSTDLWIASRRTNDSVAPSLQFRRQGTPLSLRLLWGLRRNEVADFVVERSAKPDASLRIRNEFAHTVARKWHGEFDDRTRLGIQTAEYVVIVGAVPDK